MATKAQESDIKSKINRQLDKIERQIADLQLAKKKTLEYFQSDEYNNEKERESEYEKLIAFISKDMEFKKLKRISDKLNEDGNVHRLKVTLDVKVLSSRECDGAELELDFDENYMAYEIIRESPEFRKLQKKCDADVKKHNMACRKCLNKLLTLFKPKILKADPELIDELVAEFGM